MANPTSANPGPASPEPRVSTLLIEKEMKEAYLNYAMSVIYARALPDVRDGLKPSQRRILVAMNDLGLTPRSKYRKCAKIAGDTSGNYHPHGEGVIYPTLVRLAQDFTLRYALIEGQGNYGSIDGDPPAAMRYTEARLAGPSMEMLADLDLGTVDFRPNYDETRQEPVVLPGRFPNLLCNGSDGIAVGMATSLPPHNLNEIVDALIALLDDPEVPVEELLRIVPGPDFPTGGIICGREGIEQAYRTGRGLLKLRGRVEIESKKDRDVLVVTEIPYQQRKSAIIERIAELVKEDRITGISDIRDESDREGIRIVVELKKGEETQVVLNQLYEYTPLQATISVINLALVGGRPRTLALKPLLECHRDHRFEVLRRRTRFLLRKAEERLHIAEGLAIAVDHIDEVVSIIRKSANTPEAKTNLRARFSLSEVQAQAIVDMRLGRLTGLERSKLEEEIASLKKEIEEYHAILGDDAKVFALIRAELLDLKAKYGDPRRTKFAEAIEKFVAEDLIPEEAMVVTVTRDGYIKRTALTSFRAQGRGGKGVIGSDTKEGDILSQLFVASTHDYLLLFSDDGKVRWLKVHALPELGRAAKGRAIGNLLALRDGVKITSILPVDRFDGRHVVFATRRGVAKKTPLAAYSRPKRGGIIAIRIDEGDRLIGVGLTSGGEDVILATHDGYAVRFPESNVRPMGRPARGVRGITLRKDDFVVDMVIAKPGVTLLTACEKGRGKRTALDEYRRTRRGGKGIINIRTTEKNGKVVNLLAVSDEDQILLVSEQGQIVRIRAKDVSVIGRATQGVKLIDLAEGDRLVAAEPVVREESQEAAAEAAAAARAERAKAPAAPAPTVGEVEKLEEEGEEDEPEEEAAEEEEEDEEEESPEGDEKPSP
ncbi:MAG TPA: DNA gyrase subunit A [Planctomycetota bacterium]|jgi:DNA gyrase subunit A|nr:DNA gyrase subunit A [Planctomycetota bacterium]